ncbi:tRNA-splicing endonuclease subunit Sen2 isoform X3 [Alligator sinensis]|uniref:tRNA-splicing endonuclease subunit Sen2 n=1 Tax=Alligator sinensis TaxID=38654 RepID=A0A3Q0GQ50_ALLSI|nr:tRNA-splicing endonuclease subunit Sen2 isoform X3 [Alligator sinensis]
MAEAGFRAPRRKRRVYEPHRPPFPLPASRHFGPCRAEMLNNHVLVRSPEDMEQLYSQGYFGKGILSRSRPEYSISDPLLVGKWRDAQINMPILTSKKYHCHVEWAKSLMQEQGLDDNLGKILENYIKPVPLPFMKEEGEADQCSKKMAPEIENKDDKVELSKDSSIINGDVVAPNVECHKESLDCKKPYLEGDPLHDPLAEYGSKELDTMDSTAMLIEHCQKHNYFTVYSGCKAEDNTEQQVSSKLASSTEYVQEYVLVQEEESSLCHDEAANEQSNEPLTILELWKIFSDVQPSFRTTYMTYHYFRSKGWVPKVGLKYGTDFLLYRKGPPFYHASYSVMAELVNDDFRGSLRRPFSWKSLSGLNRTTTNVSKELILCYLIRPSDMTEKEMSSPECMKRIKVQELIVNRWVSSRERNEQDEL